MFSYVNINTSAEYITLHETRFLTDVYDIANAANSEQQWQQFYIIHFISFISLSDSNYNFALSKPTVQSSTLSNNLGSYASSLAVDGNRLNIASYNNKPTCSITNTDGTAWWRVDLQHEIPVVRVTITNREHSVYWVRLNNFEIRIGNSLVDEGMVNPKCGEQHSIGRGLTETITCSPPLSGRYLLVDSLQNTNLQICELEVYTDPSLIGE